MSPGSLLKGVTYHAGGATTNSIVMRSQSGTVRYIETQHRWHKNRFFAEHDLAHHPVHSSSADDGAEGENALLKKIRHLET